MAEGSYMKVEKDKDIVILKLTPEDLSDPYSTSRAVEAFLKVNGERKFVADLSQVDSIYSMQIGTLVAIHCMCYENLAVMKLAGASEKVKALLRMVGLETLMEMHHGTGVAKQSFGPTVVTAKKRSTKFSDPRLKR